MNHWKLRKPIITLLLASALLFFASAATAAPQEEPAAEEISLWSAVVDTLWDWFGDVVTDDGESLTTTQTQSQEAPGSDDSTDAGAMIDPMG